MPNILENGVEVLVEKPVVKKHAEILSKISNKKDAGLFKNRYNSALTKLKKDITNNKIGKINLVDYSFWHEIIIL